MSVGSCTSCMGFQNIRMSGPGVTLSRSLNPNVPVDTAIRGYPKEFRDCCGKAKMVKGGG